MTVDLMEWRPVTDPNGRRLHGASLYKATFAIPTGETSYSFRPASAIAGTIVGAWLDPTTLTVGATIKAYQADDGLSTPDYFIDYTVPNPAVETRSLLSKRMFVAGKLTIDVAAATAADTAVIYILVAEGIDTESDDVANAIGDPTDAPDTDEEDATAKTGISLWKSLKNYARLLNACITANKLQVDVKTITAGDTNIGNVDIASALPTGTNTIGKLAANSGVDIGDVDVLTLPTQGDGVAVTITRPANTTAYTANDCVGAAAAAIQFANVVAGAGEYFITSASLEIDVAAVPANMGNFKLHLYNVTPPSALADNAAHDVPAGDRASYLGYIDLGTPVDLGSTLYVQQEGLNKQITALSTSIFAYLTTDIGFTPAGNSEVYVVTIHTVRV